MSGPLVRRSAAGPICRLVLNRPEKRNALNRALLQALWDGLQWAMGYARIVILSAEGPAFCAGLDLEEAADPAVAQATSELIAAVYRALAESPFIAIAAVQGAAIAGGAGLMTACDLPWPRRARRSAIPKCAAGWWRPWPASSWPTRCRCAPRGSSC